MVGWQIGQAEGQKVVDVHTDKYMGGHVLILPYSPLRVLSFIVFNSLKKKTDGGGRKQDSLRCSVPSMSPHTSSSTSLHSGPEAVHAV